MAEERLMRALVHDGYDGGVARLKHVQVPIPTPNKDEILIKMEATSLNPFDWKSYQLKRFLRPFFARNSPLIPALDFAGEVVEVGSEVKKFKPEDKVVASLNLIAGGGLSEYGVAKESLTVSRPAQVSAAQAAGLPISGVTAYAALTEFGGIKLDGTGPRKNILITAASGGVGQYAVQLAKMGNAHVTATCGARNIDLVKTLGADEVLDYMTPEGAALKSPSGKKYDVVVYGASGISWSVFESCLAENGIVVHLTPGPSAMWSIAMKKLTFSKKKMVPLIMLPKGDGSLDYLLNLVKEGKLKTQIDSVHSLGEAEEAWRKGIDGHATGKIIIEP